MAEKLAGELIAASKNEGATIKKKKMYIKWRMRIKHLRILEHKKKYKERFICQET